MQKTDITNSEKKGSTINSVQKSKLEMIKQDRKNLEEWGLYRYPTPSKKIRSISLLRKKIQNFFKEHDPNIKTEDLPTPTQLAIYLGYPSQTAMYKEINKGDEPEYSAILERAVDVLKDNIQRRQLKMAQKMNDWKGVDAVLQRLDREFDKTSPTDKKNEINISISIEKQERVKSLVTDSIDKLMMDAEFEETKTEEIPLLTDV